MKNNKFKEKKPEMISSRFLPSIIGAAFCSGIFAIGTYVLGFEERTVHTFFMGFVFYGIIFTLIITRDIILAVEMRICSIKNNVNPTDFPHITDGVKNYIGESLESLTKSYNKNIKPEGDNIFCIYGHFRYKFIVDSNGIILNILEGYSVPELGFAGKVIQKIAIKKMEQKEKFSISDRQNM